MEWWFPQSSHPHSCVTILHHSLPARQSSLPRVLPKQAPENESDTLRNDGHWRKSLALITVDYKEPLEIAPLENNSSVYKTVREGREKGMMGGRESRERSKGGKEGKYFFLIHEANNWKGCFWGRDGWAERKGKQKEVRKLMKNGPAVSTLDKGLEDSHSSHCSATYLLNYKWYPFSGFQFPHLCNGDGVDLESPPRSLHALLSQEKRRPAHRLGCQWGYVSLN